MEVNASNRAVFLSYASQDAEAAKRICDALHAAGVEVWFDQSELRGGDSWDQKIRRQIKECALFVPVISANTQARAEGYFRLEWRLADQRTHLMGRSKAFVVPVTIDHISETDADVPDSFVAVQWTALSDNQSSAEFAQRVTTLLREPPKETSDRRTPERSTTSASLFAPNTTPMKRRLWASIVVVTAALAATVWRMTHTRVSAVSAAVSAVTTSARNEPPSETRRLVAEAWDEMNHLDMWRPELERASELCRKATVLDPNDADAWAAWSQADSLSVYNGFSSLAKTADQAREKVAHAVALSPNGFETRLAEASLLVRGGGESGLSPLAGQAELLLRGLLRERPDEPRALVTLGLLLRNSGRADETRAVFQALANNSKWAAAAWNELGWAELHFHQRNAAEAAADRSIAVYPFWANLNLKLYMALWCRGDTIAAKAMLTKITARVLQDDRGLWLVCEVYFACDEPEMVLQALAGVSRPWLSSSAYVGPTCAFVGEAHAAAGRREAAELNWRSALKQVDERLADAPQSAVLLNLKGTLTAELGRRDDAEKCLKLARELAIGDNEASQLQGTRATDEVLLGNYAEAVKCIENDAREGSVFGTKGFVQYFRFYRALRGYPAFEALLQRIKAGEFDHAADGGSAAATKPGTTT